jgi:hypothetical protein
MPPASPSRVLPRYLPLAALLALLAIAAVAVAGDSATGAGPDTASQPHIGSVKDSPGYTPPVDSEAYTELLGRRPNAPRVNKPFSGGAHSLKDFGRTVARLIQHDRRDSLERLCVRSDEFRDILWPEFPQSRPATGIQWGDAWFFLYTRNHKGCGQAIEDWGGQNYHFIGVTCDSTKQYKNFKMYSKLKIVVRGANADTVKWDWVKAIVERRQRFKILALRD